MVAYIDVENTNLRSVQTIEVDIKSFDDETDNIILDLSKLNDEDYKTIEDAINPEIDYLDIELFMIENENIPYFGPDYEFFLSKQKKELKGVNVRLQNRK